ncbi:hypothetical protein [Kribbella steppae]|uniref:hypothetical protein n=1 Tax=Kribbella steppae TaxID=2512223 RepID=UPI00130EA61C|nr:hypothetical protein [Kribbella steppae]
MEWKEATRWSSRSGPADWAPLSPFHQAFTDGPLGAGLPAAYLWLLGGAAVLVAIALPALDGRDIATSHGR